MRCHEHPSGPGRAHSIGCPADHDRNGWTEDMSGPALRVIAALIAGLVVAACGGGNGPRTAWGDGSFKSNGERIYFTARSDRGTEISSTGGPDIDRMMMGGRVSCASCHGADAGGGLHNMGMDVMSAPPIRLVPSPSTPMDRPGIRKPVITPRKRVTTTSIRSVWR